MVSRGAQVYHDLNGLNQIKVEARSNTKGALKSVAQQFESVFVKMMIKSMRDASFGDPLFESDNSKFYREMYDDQLALEMSRTGSIGLANSLVRQLERFVPEDQMNVPEESKPVSNQAVQVASSTAPIEYRRRSFIPPASFVEAAKQKEAIKVETATTTEKLGTPEKFINAFWDEAKSSAKEIGVSPAVLIAQAGLETGWGKYVMEKSDGNSSHNLFNIKAGSAWQGETVARSVLEYENGAATQERSRFRAYDSYADSFSDYVKFIQQSPRYQAALEVAGDASQYVRALQDAGYATDPNYAAKIEKIIQREPRLNADRTLTDARQQVVGIDG